jgi:hypothetical protein
MLFVYSFTTIFLGAPPGDPKFALIIGLAGVVALTLFGHRALEVCHRQNFWKLSLQGRVLRNTRDELHRNSVSLIQTKQEAELMQHRADATEMAMKVLCDAVVTASVDFTILRHDGKLTQILGRNMVHERLREHLLDAHERARFERFVSAPESQGPCEGAPPKLINLSFRTARGQPIEAEVLISDAGDRRVLGSHIDWRYLLGFRLRTADGASPPAVPPGPGDDCNLGFAPPGAVNMCADLHTQSLKSPSEKESMSIIELGRTGMFKTKSIQSEGRCSSSKPSPQNSSRNIASSMYSTSSVTQSNMHQDGFSQAESMSVVEVSQLWQNLGPPSIQDNVCDPISPYGPNGSSLQSDSPVENSSWEGQNV